MHMKGIGGIPIILSGAFVGAYDAIPNIVAAYGMRRLRSAYTGSLLRLRRSSDNTEQDFGYDGNGNLDTAAIATFLGGGSGFVVTWYDQSGNGRNATQATAANQPLYVASGQNNRPTISFDGSNDILQGTQPVPGFSTGVTALVGAHAISWNHASFPVLVSNEDFPNSTGWRYGNDSSASDTILALRIEGVASGRPEYSNAAVTPTIFVAHYTASDGAAKLFENGVQKISVTYSRGSISDSAIGLAIGNLFKGEFFEILICNAPLSTADRQAAEQAANSYWSLF